MWQGPRRLTCATSYFYRLRLCQDWLQINLLCNAARIFQHSHFIQCETEDRSRWCCCSSPTCIHFHLSPKCVTNVRYSHCLLQFSTSASCLLFFFRAGSLPFIAPTDSAILSPQCFLLQFPCTRADAFLANPFTVSTLTASVYTLTRYSNSLSFHLAVCSLQPLLTSALTAQSEPHIRSIAILRSRLPSFMGFTTFLSTTRAFGYSVDEWQISFCGGKF